MISKRSMVDSLYLIGCSIFIGIAVLGGAVLNSTVMFLPIYLISIILSAGLTYKMFFSKEQLNDMGIVLLLPSVLSAVQNIYLALIASQLSVGVLQLLLVINFVLGVLYVLFFAVQDVMQKKVYDRYVAKLILLIAAEVFYGAFLFILYGGSISAMISSMRNLFSLFLFTIVGIKAYEKMDVKHFLRLICIILFIVMIVGLYQRFINPDMWIELNISELWNKKGIVTEVGALPVNHTASEPIGGKWWLRMTSTFADPVNLGTFLFAGFMVAWYLKKKWLCLLTVVGIMLVISKGALLGIFVFSVLYCYYKMPKSFFWGMSVACVLAGIAFLIYSYTIGGGSVFVHISGFFTALEVLWTKPLGYGIGNIGTLAMVMGMTQDVAIYESGLGMIIGQLGVVGTLIYLYFFGTLVFYLSKLKNVKDRIFAMTLLWAIVANLMFNEVALSPNSSAIYFMLIGLWVAKARAGEQTIIYSNV